MTRRRIKLDNGNYSNHRPVDLDCLAEVAGAEELEGLHPTKEFRVESALELKVSRDIKDKSVRISRAPPKFSQIVPGLRVGRRGDTRIGTVTDPPGIGGWAKVRFDGERSAASVRPSSLRIVLFESRESHANLGSYERKNDAAAKSRRIKSSSPMAMEKEKPARNPSLTSSHRRGVLSVGTRVAVLKKKRDVTRGCGTIVEVLLRGWLKIRFDGEEAVSNASFQTRMLEFLDTRQDRAIATRENPAEADRLDVDSPVEKKRANFQNSFQVGDIVAVARGNDVERIGLHGVVNHIYRNGWRTVVLDGGVEEFPFRPWQLEAVATKEYGSAESHQSISASVHGEGAESSYSPATTEKPNWLHGRNRRVRFDVGERVTIIEDKKDAECIGKTGIVLRVSSKGWRRIRRLDTHEIRNYRSVNLHEAAAFEDTAPPALATDDSRNEGKKSPSAIPTRQVIIIGKNSKHFNKRGVLVAKKKGGWCQIFLDGGEEVHYRKEHIKEVGNQDRNGRVTNKQPKEHSHLSKKALGMQVGDRIRLKEKYHYKLTGAVDDDVLGFGTVSGIGTAGQHRVILDHATKDGTRSICVPRDRLKILDADFADDDVRSKSSSIQKVARPPPYQHINRMCFTASAKKVLSERAAKRSGMQRRICADDAEPPTCECISRRAWNVRIAKKLAERRRKQEPDKTGHVSNSRETVEDEDDEEDDPLLKRAKKRRSCAASDIESSQGAQDDFELVFENESEREFAIAEEKKKTIGVECDIDCLNRQLCVECAPSSCAHGERCKNRQFQRRQIKHVLVRKTPHCGWGLVCGEPVRRGEFIIEALGELVAKEEAEARLRAAEARGETNFYMIDCESSGNLVVDATRKGNESRFTNHSCDPSCELNKWRVGDTERYGLFAKRHLNVGEEITFNYRWKQAIWHHSLQSRPCNCGAKNCAGFFGAMSTSSSQQGSVSSSAKKPGALKRRRSREDVAERRYEGNYESTEDDRESKRSRADTENSELPLAAVSLSRRLADAVRTAKSILFSGNSDDLEDSTGLLWSKNQSSLRVVGLTKRLMREWTSTQGDQFGDDDDVVEPSPSNADADGTLSPTAVSDEESVHPVCSGPDGVSVVGLDSLASLSSGNVIFNEYFARRARKSEPKLLDNVRGRRLEDVKDLLGSVRIEGLRNAMLEIVDSVGPAVTASDDDGDDGDRHLRMMDDANDPSVPLVVGNSLSS